MKKRLPTFFGVLGLLILDPTTRHWILHEGGRLFKEIGTEIVAIKIVEAMGEAKEAPLNSILAVPRDEVPQPATSPTSPASSIPEATPAPALPRAERYLDGNLVMVASGFAMHDALQARSDLVPVLDWCRSTALRNTQASSKARLCIKEITWTGKTKRFGVFVVVPGGLLDADASIVIGCFPDYGPIQKNQNTLFRPYTYPGCAEDLP